MLPTTTRDRYKVRGYIPELGQYLIRDAQSNALELWTPSRGLLTGAQFTIVQGVELEFVREAKAYRVIDNEYNRRHCPHEIGRIFVDRYPLGADVQEL